MVRQSPSRHSEHLGANSVRSYRPASSTSVSSSNRNSSPTKSSHGPLSIIDRYTWDKDDPNGSQCSSPSSWCPSTTTSEDPAGYPEFDLPTEEHRVYGSDAIPSSPAEFDKSFPSRQRLRIHHDDATSDGNMNLRVDIDASDRHGRPQKLILYHLRMQDLKARKFSLRRYSRDSGREVCKSSCELTPPASAEQLTTAMLSPLGQALRQLRLTYDESGSRDSQGHQSQTDRSGQGYGQRRMQPTETAARNITLQFSNYAQVNVEERGSTATQRYEYEFWGVKYRWQRQVVQMHQRKMVSFHLVSRTSLRSIAHITPDYLTAAESQEEQYMGSWVPPCTLQIVDKRIFRGLTDVADVIVATGLVALVNDSIERCWHDKNSYRLDLPDAEAPGKYSPDRLIDEVFNRRGHTT